MSATMHRITIEPNPHRVTVRLGDQVVLETRAGLILREAGLPPVHYLPRADADMRFFERTEKHSRCPFKGEASYFSLKTADQTIPDAVWTYETPNPEVSEIKEYLAFYPDKVTITETE